MADESPESQSEAERATKTPSDPFLQTGLSPSDAHMAETAFNALGPMVEADKERRERALEEPSLGEAAQNAGLTSEQGAMAEAAFTALGPMVEADRQRREGVTDGAVDGATDAGIGDSFGNAIAQGVEAGLAEQPSTFDDSSGDSSGDAWGDSGGGSFEDRSPDELDPGFSLPDDSGSPDPADMDRGFTPTPTEHMDFSEDEVEPITANTQSDDSGFFEE